MAKVITFTAGGRERVMFDGDEEDARKYLVNNFPRPHVEPGSGLDPVPDAVLDIDGDRTAYADGNWSEYVPADQKSNRTPAPDDRDQTITEQDAMIARLRAELAAANGGIGQGVAPSLDKSATPTDSSGNAVSVPENNTVGISDDPTVPPAQHSAE